MRQIDTSFMLQYFLIREDALENSYGNCCHFKDLLACNFKQWNFISDTVLAGESQETSAEFPNRLISF